MFTPPQELPAEPVGQQAGIHSKREARRAEEQGVAANVWQTSS